MKDILFVIDSLSCGGAEKSLISLLSNIDYSLYNVDLLLLKRGGEFEKFLPKEVNLLESPEYFKFLNGKYKGSIQKKIQYMLYRLKTTLNLRINNISKKAIHSEQVVYKSINSILNPLDKKYDIAIAYNQGFPTYLVADKVQAYKKLAWINCNYVKTMYDKDLDNKFYNQIDKIIVVSQFIYDSMSKMKYGYKDKMKIILDIIDPKLIINMSLEKEPKELKDIDEFKILTVGRLATVKGYDLAVKAANLLKNNSFKFKWFIIGEGAERKYIEDLIIKYNLENEVILLGAKPNPYPYMKMCDLYVQTSRKEGFGLTVMEAKILKNVIVATNFDTINELLSDKIDGVIVEQNENSIYEAIKQIINNNACYNEIKSNVEKLIPYSSVNEINKFYEEIS
ncbi:glycosyltransferase [Clostridium celatum]|uniref:glycosyltransferase n=1 Tax=Clostridium celatum TaxID=36834 RepID=UPI002900EE66|nr:glycosyltransferase [Clostridium celatum]MDU2265558.1 glycosyltransferase [Clostridium celatum]MDU6295414.1 glycosyltransferase [Clostridium celatum]